jgi:hypothetical protein
MNFLLENREKVNKQFVNYHTNLTYNELEDFDTNCHITKKLLIYLFECKSCEKNISNFCTIYFEYKGIGHSCCIYRNKILQSFANYHYLKCTNLEMGLDELYNSIEEHIDLFYPEYFINLDKEPKLYTSISYYFTDITEEKFINNLKKLLSGH